MIRGQKSIAEEVPKISVPVEAKLHNRFDFEVVDSVTGEVKQRAYAENIILNSWWTRIFTPAVANAAIHVGTGSGTLDPARTALFTFLSGKASTEVTTVSNETENWISHKRTAQWLETDNPNTVWTEVGIAYSSTSSSLTTHALIKDLNGNPVTLNKGTTDIINVYSTVYVYLPAPTSGIKFIMPRNLTIDRSLLACWLVGCTGSFPLGLYYALKGNVLTTYGGYSGSYGNVIHAYNSSGTPATRTGSAATKKLTATITRLPAASFNDVTGVKAIVFGIGSSGYGTELQLNIPDAWYPYSAITGETIGTGDGSALDFKTYFPFIKNDSSFVLKKNGVVVDPADYTVDYGEPNGTNLIPHMNVLDYYGSQDSLGVPVYAGASYANDYVTFENPWYQKYGITSVAGYYSALYVSDSPTGPWTLVVNAPTGSTYSVPAQYQKSRYWKWKATNTTPSPPPSLSTLNSTDLTNAKNTHFVAGKAPANGDVITADYRCEVVAKTSNNVFDLTVEITLQEKVV